MFSSGIKFGLGSSLGKRFPERLPESTATPLQFVVGAVTTGMGDDFRRGLTKISLGGLIFAWIWLVGGSFQGAKDTLDRQTASGIAIEYVAEHVMLIASHPPCVEAIYCCREGMYVRTKNVQPSRQWWKLWIFRNCKINNLRSLNVRDTAIPIRPTDKLCNQIDAGSVRLAAVNVLASFCVASVTLRLANLSRSST